MIYSYFIVDQQNEHFLSRHVPQPQSLFYFHMVHQPMSSFKKLFFLLRLFSDPDDNLRSNFFANGFQCALQTKSNLGRNAFWVADHKIIVKKFQSVSRKSDKKEKEKKKKRNGSCQAFCVKRKKRPQKSTRHALRTEKIANF